jgi:hypothetical protein
MLLDRLSSFTLEESRIFCSDMVILERGEGPRWRFNYGNFKVDPSPDILLLGAYRHPSTGNNLVGGINLHYLNSSELDKLQKALPRIMAATNLYNRYHTGKRLLPEIFRRFYRTYNSSYIRGVEQDTLYPKLGLIGATQDWLKKKLGGIFKSKEQRQKELEPQYPTDLTNMRDRLNQVVQQLQQQPVDQEPEDSPEMQVARDTYRQEQQKQQPRTMQDIERQEDIPLQQANQEFERYQRAKQAPEAMVPEVEPQDEPEDELDLPIVGETDPPDVTTPEGQADARAQFEKEKQESQEELLNPDNEIDLEESIVYYSPIAGRYIIEPAYNLVHSSW